MNKILQKITGVSAAILAAGLAVTPVCAEGKIYTPISGTTTTFDSTIYMRDTASVPNLNFYYRLRDMASGDTKIPGTPANGVSGMPTFKEDGNVTLEDGRSYAGILKFSPSDTKTTSTSITKTVTVDFTGVTFKEPGVYRYSIAEMGFGQGLTNEDINHKEEVTTPKFLDVYITDDGSGHLVVSNYVMHDVSGPLVLYPGADGEITLEDKDSNFEHLLTTSDITLTKTVTGNQGSKDQYFKFTVEISMADGGTKYDVDLSNADATTKITGKNTEAHTNPSELITRPWGWIKQDFWLQHGQSIKIQGLGPKTKYTITEAEDGTGAPEYETNIKVTGDATNIAEADIASVNGKEVTDKAVTKDTTVAYTNNRQGAVPTGLIMSVGGPVTIAALGGAGLVAISAKKKKEDEE